MSLATVASDEDERPDREVGALARRYSDITPIEQEWLWRGYVPMGTVTLLASPGGAGKTFVATDLAARCSRGDCMPDGTAGRQPGNAMFVGLEDSPEASTIHRLTAANADLERIWDVSEGPEGAGFDVTTDVPWLRALVDEMGGVDLLVIDTLAAASSVSLSSVQNSRKRVLAPLLAFAKDTGAAVLVLHHLTKSGDVAGSPGLVNGTRQVLKIEVDEADPRTKTIVVDKTNVAEKTDGAAYRIEGDGRDGHVAWSWDTAGRASGPQASAQERILMLLRSLDRPLSAQEIASKTGLNYAVVRVLLVKLGKRGLVASAGRAAYTVPAPAPVNNASPEAIRTLTVNNEAAV